MPTQTGAGVEGHKAERLGRRRTNHLPHVDVQPITHKRHFVHQADVHGAERVFEQLDHFSGSGRGYRHNLVNDCAVINARQLLTGIRCATNHLGRIAHAVQFVGRVNPLRRKCHEYVLAGRQSALFEPGDQDFVGCARISGAFQHNQHAGVRNFSDSICRADNIRHIRIFGFGERGRHANAQGVSRLQIGIVGRRPEFA